MYVSVCVCVYVACVFGNTMSVEPIYPMSGKICVWGFKLVYPSPLVTSDLAGSHAHALRCSARGVCCLKTIIHTCTCTGVHVHVHVACGCFISSNSEHDNGGRMQYERRLFHLYPPFSSEQDLITFFCTYFEFMDAVRMCMYVFVHLDRL